MTIGQIKVIVQKKKGPLNITKIIIPVDLTSHTLSLVLLILILLQ